MKEPRDKQSFRKNAVSSFFTVKSLADVARIFRLQTFLSLSLGKFYMMWQCGCQVNELNNWVSHAIRTPWYWRTAADGTRFVAGPYSSIWYILNFPAHYGYWVWMEYLWAIDLAFTGFIFLTQSWKFVLPYMMSSVYFYNVDPIDIFIFYLSILPVIISRAWTIIGPVMAILTKLPVDAPAYVWSFILNNPYGVHEPGGIFRYFQLASWFFVGIIFYLYRRRYHAKPNRDPPLLDVPKPTKPHPDPSGII